MTPLTLRLAGGALLVLSGALLGNAKYTELRRRARTLRDLCAALGRLEAELTALGSPLEDAFFRLRDCPFFALLAAGFGTEPPDALWRRAAEAQPLSAEERRALAEAGGVLGRCDAQRQAAELALTRDRLAAFAEALEREIARRGRRYAPLGAALGAILAAVLF